MDILEAIQTRRAERDYAGDQLTAADLRPLIAAASWAPSALNGQSGQFTVITDRDLLKLISEQPRHGYDLIRAVEDMTGGEYAPSPGVVYPTLTMLQDMGFIEEAAGEGPRKPFQITDAGRSHLEENAEDTDDLMERLRDLAPGDEPAAGPAIGRAVKNLMTALKHRVGRDGLNDDLLHEIAAILDEAAQRIERIKSTDYRPVMRASRSRLTIAWW